MAKIAVNIMEKLRKIAFSFAISLVVRKIVLPLHSLSKTREQDNKPSEV